MSIPYRIARAIVSRYIPTSIKLGKTATSAWKDFPGFMRGLGESIIPIQRSEFFQIWKESETIQKSVIQWRLTEHKETTIIPKWRTATKVMADRYAYPVKFTIEDGLTGGRETMWRMVYSEKRLTVGDVRKTASGDWWIKSGVPGSIIINVEIDPYIESL